MLCVLVDCDFNDDTCGWSSETADGYDKHVWLKASRTASGGTGPSTDHSTGRGNNLYLTFGCMMTFCRFTWAYYCSGISDTTGYQENGLSINSYIIAIYRHVNCDFHQGWKTVFCWNIFLTLISTK